MEIDNEGENETESLERYAALKGQLKRIHCTDLLKAEFESTAANGHFGSP